jgi:hypothetical protein
MPSRTENSGVTDLIIIVGQVLAQSWLTPEKVGTYSLIILLLVGNLAQYFSKDKERIHQTETLRADSNARLVSTRDQELADVKKELADVKTEYKAIVGLDVQLLLDFAKEGLTQRVAALERERRIHLLDIAKGDTPDPSTRKSGANRKHEG